MLKKQTTYAPPKTHRNKSFVETSANRKARERCRAEFNMRVIEKGPVLCLGLDCDKIFISPDIAAIRLCPTCRKRQGWNYD